MTLQMDCIVKVISKERMKNDKELNSKAAREMRILELSRHNNIVRHFEILHDQENFYLVSEYLERKESVDSIVRGEDEVKQIAYQLFDALQYLHKQKVVLRDLIAENVIYDAESGQLKISGLS